MPVFRSNRNIIIMHNALMGAGKLACARKLQFDTPSIFVQEQNTSEDASHSHYHVEADGEASEGTVDAEKEKEIFSSDDKMIDCDIILDKFNDTSSVKENTERGNDLSTNKEPGGVNIASKDIHAKYLDIPNNTEIKTTKTPIVVPSTEKFHVSNNSVTTHAMVHDKPENKRVKILDVKIIKPPDKSINHENIMTGLDIIEEEIQYCTEEEINIDSKLKQVNHDTSLAGLDLIEEEIQYCTEEKINIDSKLKQNADIDTRNSTQKSKKRKTSERKAKVLANKSYFDFVSDDEVPEYVWDSSSWEGSDTSNSEGDENQTCNKKKKKKNKAKRQKVTCEEDEIVNERGLKKEKKLSEKEKRRNARKLGQQYETASGRLVSEKSMKSNPCVDAKKCPYKCKDIPEEKRKNLFVHFNGLSLQRKSDWLAAMSIKDLPKRKRNNDASRREYSYLYFINDGEGRRQVCLRFLLNTLDITQKFVHYTLSNSIYGSGQQDMRGKGIPPNKTKSETITLVKQFIMNLPAVPSHHCRKDSSRVYLPSEMKNISNLYENYKKKQQQEGIDYVGEKVFRKIFSNDFNIGFHVPKKDKCNKCVKYNDLEKTNSLDEKTKLEKEKHDMERKMSDERFKFHKTIRVKDNSTLCVSFDMQKVLNTPMGENMLLFYSRKYAVYNLTFYESVTRNGYCYTWGESEGKRGANEVATILIKYLEELDTRNEAQNVLLYCDSCAGQNKNKTVMAALHYVLQRCVNIQTIQINYLLPGHTMMPVDSMHAVIENSVTATVWAPSQWATVFQFARKNFGPYNVTVLDHQDFLGVDKFGDKYFKGNLCGKISKLTTVTMKKNEKKIKVKYSMHPESPTEIIEVIGSSKQLSQVYKSSLPLPEKKYADLMQLCNKNIIPKQYHSEYKKMAVKNIPEVLMQSDEEDDDILAD